MKQDGSVMINQLFYSRVEVKKGNRSTPWPGFIGQRSHGFENVNRFANLYKALSRKIMEKKKNQ